MSKELAPDIGSLERLAARLRSFGQWEEARRVTALIKRCGPPPPRVEKPEKPRRRVKRTEKFSAEEIAREEAAYLERREKLIAAEMPDGAAEPPADLHERLHDCLELIVPREQGE
jgi:hypothetical protein